MITGWLQDSQRLGTSYPLSYTSGGERTYAPPAACVALRVTDTRLQVSGGISWLDDIQQFYRERSAIEKEYSAKLSALAKKYYEKKAKKQSSLSVGDTPTVTPGSLERYDYRRMRFGRY